MKTLLGWLMCAAVFSTSAYGTIREDIVPYLDFDENYEIPLEKLTQSYLAVSPEENHYDILSFPQQEQFEIALGLLEETLNSEEFKRKVLSYKRSDGKRLFQKNYLWKNEKERLSNEDIFNVLMKGDEAAIPGTEGEMNIYSWIKKCNFIQRAGIWCRKVIGSTDPANSEWIKINYKFYKDYRAPQMVNNLVHEWIHLLGFLHGSENMREEAPYVIGRIAQEVSQGILAARGN